MAYTKFFSDILTSTVWLEDNDTRIVWMTLLAMADQHGEVMGSVPGLAHTARVPVEACRAALDKFTSPDPDSRSQIADGRRIEKIDGGWALINYADYRQRKSKEEQAERDRARKRRYRARRSENVPACPAVSHPCPTTETQRDEKPREAEAEEDSYAPPIFSGEIPSRNSVANATGEKASPKVQIFQEYLPWMNQRAGKDCRSVLGLLCSTVGDDDALLTLRLCKEANPVDPVGWIQARMKPRESNDQRKDREVREAIERSKLQ